MADAPLISVINTTPNTSAVILDSPHSGTLYPDDLPYVCSMHALRQTEDSFVDELFAQAPAPLLRAHFARSYIDPNRAVDDIDPAILDGAFPGPLNPTERSQHGHGLIRHLCRGAAVYPRKIPVGVALKRIETCYQPYHTALTGLLAEARRYHPTVWHINCHSMASSDAFSYPRLANTAGAAHADFVLGDRDGTTAEAAFVERVAHYLRGCGYTIAINDPYKGMEILRLHGQPASGIHSLQLEINRSLYMDEDSLQKHEGFYKVQADMTGLVKELAGYLEARNASLKQAAE